MLTPEPEFEGSGDETLIEFPCKGEDLMRIEENQVSVL